MKGERRLIIFLSCLICLAVVGLFICPSWSTNLAVTSQKTQQILTDISLADFSVPLKPSSYRIFSISTDGESQLPEESISLPWESHVYGIRLKGTVGSNMAVIQNRDGSNERVIHIGESMGKATVTKIARNLLELAGPLGTETLRLPVEKSTQTSNLTFDAISPATDGHPPVVQRQKLQKILTQLDRLSEEITLQPVRSADGTPGGFRITALKPRGLLAQMGFRRHDILTTVNTQRIVSVEDVYRVLESATHQNSLTINILRNNQKMELNYVLQ